VVDGRITYREQTGSKPGTIFFNRLQTDIRNFTNDPKLISTGATMTASGSTYLMGKALVEGVFRFPLNSPCDTFSFTGRTGKIELDILNPMITNLLPVQISSGIIDSLTITGLQGNSFFAKGRLDVSYHGLQVNLRPKNKRIINYWKTELWQFLANLALPQENPGYFGKYRKGYIWNQRNDEKGFFNYFWKSVLSGLKSSVGINTPMQRAMKKPVK